MNIFIGGEQGIGKSTLADMLGHKLRKVEYYLLDIDSPQGLTQFFEQGSKLLPNQVVIGFLDDIERFPDVRWDSKLFLSCPWNVRKERLLSRERYSEERLRLQQETHEDSRVGWETVVVTGTPEHTADVVFDYISGVIKSKNKGVGKEMKCQSIGKDIELLGSAIQQKCDEYEREEDRMSKLDIWKQIQGDYATLKTKVNAGISAAVSLSGEVTGEAEAGEVRNELETQEYVCSGCSSPVSLGDTFCQYCGKHLDFSLITAAQEKEKEQAKVGEVIGDEPFTCEKCGLPVYLGDVHCPGCGSPLNWEAVNGHNRR